MNAAVGITPYQESFAVDPNEILKEDFSKLTHTYHNQNSVSNFNNTKKLKIVPLHNLQVMRNESPGLTNITEDFSNEEVDRKPFIDQQEHQFMNYICSTSRK